MPLDEIVDNGAVDQTGNGLHATVCDSPQVIADDTFGSCFDFNGKGDYLSIPDYPKLRHTTYTVACWVKPHGDLNDPWKGVVGNREGLFIYDNR